MHFIFTFVLVLEFELGALHLLGRCCMYHVNHAPSPKEFFKGMCPCPGS
jgi:hypothetical protein